MADVPVKRAKLNFDVEMNSDIFEAFKCPVCLEFFAEPKILPSCGHTLCLDCVKKMNVSGNNSCPECRASTSGLCPSKLQSNVTAQRAVDALGDNGQKGSVRNGTLGDNCPHVGFVSLSGTKCGHCSREFCSPCLALHNERLKLEVNLMFFGFFERHKDVTEKMNEKICNMKDLIQRNVLSVEEKIKKSSEALISEFTKAVYAKRDAFLEEVQKFGNVQQDELIDIAQWLGDEEKLEKVAIAVKTLNESSVLFSSSEKVAEVYDLALEFDKKLSTIKDAFEGVLNDQMEFYGWDTYEEDEPFVLNENAAELLVEGSRFSKVPSEFHKFHAAARSGDLESIKGLFQRNGMTAAYKQLLVDHLDLTGDFKGTALIQASVAGHFEVVKYLVEELNADVFITSQTEASNDPKCCAMLWAARHGHTEIVKCFLNWSPELINARTSRGSSLPIVAAYWSRADIIEFLIREKKINLNNAENSNPLLFFAVVSGNLDTVKRLIERGADVNFCNHHGNSLSMIAIMKQKFDVLKLLVENGADLSLRNRKNKTALHFAVAVNSEKIASFVLDCCPDLLEAKTNAGETALAMAVLSSNTEMIAFLESKGFKK